MLLISICNTFILLGACSTCGGVGWSLSFGLIGDPLFEIDMHASKLFCRLIAHWSFDFQSWYHRELLVTSFLPN